jgi:hypothetical protein
MYLHRSLTFLPLFLTAYLTTFFLVHALDCYTKAIPLTSPNVVYNNIMFNVVTGSSKLYGVDHALWYIYSAVPQVIGVYLPIYFVGLYKTNETNEMNETNGINETNILLEKISTARITTARITTARLTTLFYVTILSISAHKEIRFVFPIIPLMLLDVNHYIVTNCRHSDLSLSRGSSSSRGSILSILRVFRYANVAAFVFLSVIWQSGGIYVMYKLQSLITASNASSASISSVSIDMLTSCHATPGHSHLFDPFVNVDLSYIDCSVACRRSDSCENDLYLSNPERYVQEKELTADYVVTENNWDVMVHKGGYVKEGDYWVRPGEYMVLWRKADDVVKVESERGGEGEL